MQSQSSQSASSSSASKHFLGLQLELLAGSGFFAGFGLLAEAFGSQDLVAEAVGLQDLVAEAVGLQDLVADAVGWGSVAAWAILATFASGVRPLEAVLGEAFFISSNLLFAASGISG